MSDVYVHDFSNPIDGSAILGIVIITGHSGSVSVDMNNVTVSNLDLTGADSQVYGVGFTTGVFSSVGFSPGSINATVNNLTVNKIVSTSNQSAAGVGVLSGVSGGSSSIELKLTNSTVRDVEAPEHTLFTGLHGSGVFTGGAVANTNDSVNINIQFTNVVLSNALNMPAASCDAVDFGGLIGGTGTATTTITSNGGNLSDDSSCSSYFNKPTDQNNVSALADTLAPLADNGGFVPTMALLPGSPAIDSGVSVAGLTTDARQATRPQGTAYDSGAYESPYSKTTASLAGTGESVIWLSILAGSTLVSAGLCVVVFQRQSAHQR